MGETLLRIENLTKDFAGVRAVNDVSFDIMKNTVHCLIGENGAGKSTLIKMLSGTLERTEGKIFLNGKEYYPNDLRSARQNGISTLFQELNTVDQLTVEENLTLGQEDTRFSFLVKTDKIKKMLGVLKEVDPRIDPKQKVSELSVAQKQLVEIARAIASECNIIILDEPTAAISEVEINELFKIIRRLKEDKVTFIYISHRLDEIFEIGDYVTIMRDGRHIVTMPLKEVESREQLIKNMTGKTLYEKYIKSESTSDETVLEVQHVTNKKLRDVSFDLKKGEIIGFYGLVGAGKTELAHTIFGLDNYEGSIKFLGKEVEKPSKMVKRGVVLVPEERRTQSIFPILTVRQNITAENLEAISHGGILDKAAEKKVAAEQIKNINIKTSSPEKEIMFLSGGNQQKVVFSRSVFAGACLFLLDEPTRGVDVGAKAEIYSIIRDYAKEGKSIILFSSELTEIINMCDRIFLLYDGEVKAEIVNSVDFDAERAIHIVTGGDIQ